MEPIRKIDIFENLADSPEIVLDKLNEIIDRINLLQEKIGTSSVGMKVHDLEEAIRKERARQDTQNSYKTGQDLAMYQARKNSQSQWGQTSQTSLPPNFGSSSGGISMSNGI